MPDFKKQAAENLAGWQKAFDNYQIALSHIPEADKKQAWAIGLEHTFKLWESFLNEQGVKEIEARGKKFDPEYHESIGQVENKDLADQEIVEVKQIGYSYQDQVLRPSKVIINNLI